MIPKRPPVAKALHVFRSRALQYPWQFDPLGRPISPRTYRAGYERFRPNIRGYHLDCTYYRGGWHVSYPLLIRQPFYSWQKPRKGHSKFLCHTFVYCRIFAPAAPRRARVLISVPFSGLPLSRPVWIFGLVGSYPANYLIHRSPILKRQHLHGVRHLRTETFQFPVPMMH